MHGRAAARPLAVPRLLPEAGARPPPAERSSDSSHHVEEQQRLQGARGQQRRSGGRRRRRATSDRAPRAGAPTPIAHAADRLVRDRAARSRCSRPRSSIVLVRSLRPRTTRGVHERVAAHRDRRASLTSGVFIVRAVALRARRRPVPGDARAWSRSTASRCSCRRVVLVATLLALLLVGGLPETRAPRRARVLRADAVLGHRHDADGVGQRPHHRLPRRSRSCRSRCTCSPRSTAGASTSQEAGSSTSCSARSRRRCSSTASRSSTARPARRTSPASPTSSRRTTLLARRRAAARHRVPARRPRLQGRGRAVPHVDARRVPGRAHAGHRVHGRRRRRRPRSPRCCACFVGAFALYSVDWRPIVWGLAVLSLLVGSIAAIVQTDVKRMLAYSSISHAGYVLIGVQAATAEGHERGALLPARVRGDGDRRVRGRRRWSPASGDDDHALADVPRARARAQPVLAGLLTLFLLAQAGVPLTGGFVAKLSVFSAAVDAGQYSLALIGMLAAVIGAFVYLRIVLTMYAPGRRRGAAPAGADARRPRRRRHRASRSRSRRRGRAVPRHPARRRARLREARHPTPCADASRCATRVRVPVSRRRGSGRSPARRNARGARRRCSAAGACATAAVERRVAASSYACVDQLARAREVEQVARVAAGAGARSTSMLGRHVAQLELEALAARVHEARHHDVERRALDAVGRCPTTR